MDCKRIFKNLRKVKINLFFQSKNKNKIKSLANVIDKTFVIKHPYNKQTKRKKVTYENSKTIRNHNS